MSFSSSFSFSFSSPFLARPARHDPISYHSRSQQTIQIQSKFKKEKSSRIGVSLKRQQELKRKRGRTKHNTTTRIAVRIVESTAQRYPRAKPVAGPASLDFWFLSSLFFGLLFWFVASSRSSWFSDRFPQGWKVWWLVNGITWKDSRRLRPFS